jgi:hypothetical protein
MDVHRMSCIEWMTETAADAHTEMITATALSQIHHYSLEYAGDSFSPIAQLTGPVI